MLIVLFLHPQQRLDQFGLKFNNYVPKILTRNYFSVPAEQLGGYFPNNVFLAYFIQLLILAVSNAILEPINELQICWYQLVISC